MMTNARIHQGTLTISDHRMLVTTMKMKWCESHKNKNRKTNNITQKIDTQKIVHNKDVQNLYNSSVQEKIENSDKSWNKVSKIVMETAKDVIGYTKRMNRKPKSENEKIKKMSKTQKEIKIQIEKSNDEAKVRELRKKRNKLLKEIKKEQRVIIDKEINEATDAIANAQYDNQFFKAVKYIRNQNTKQKAIVHDKKGREVKDPVRQYNIVKEHFQKQFFDPNKKEIERYVGEPRQLNCKISQDEVKKAVSKASNNKATGEDRMAVELIKYGPENLQEAIANSLNDLIENHNETMNTGQSILLPIPKPKKEIGPPKNLRPLNLLNTIRKILSTITLIRIRDRVDCYLSRSQAAYRNNRSTTDIVWAHRFIIAKVLLYQKQEIMITGLDMSSAFDTIDRAELMNILESILDDDELRMCRILLSKTTMTLRFGTECCETFKTNKGSPQGDAISGVFFNVAFEHALRDLRTEMNKISPLIEHNYCKKSLLPTEVIYADDSDFVTQDNHKNNGVQRIADPILGKHSLKVNNEKWEKTIIKRGTKKSEEEENEWRRTKKLGSLLGDYEDMKRRKQLANAAMKSVDKIWPSKKFRINQKLKIYKTIVKSVLTYNYSTWGLTKKQEEELNRTHRRHLRTIWNNPFMSNKNVYEKSKENKMSDDMRKARWKALGHMLRREKDTPCQQAMEYYFEMPVKAKKFSGRKRRTLPIILNDDIERAAVHHIIPIPKFKTKNH